MTPFQPEKYLKTLGVPPDIFPVEMTSFIFLSQHRDTQVMFYLLNIV